MMANGIWPLAHYTVYAAPGDYTVCVRVCIKIPIRNDWFWFWFLLEPMGRWEHTGLITYLTCAHKHYLISLEFHYIMIDIFTSPYLLTMSWNVRHTNRNFYDSCWQQTVDNGTPHHYGHVNMLCSLFLLPPTHAQHTQTLYINHIPFTVYTLDAHAKSVQCIIAPITKYPNASR